MTISDLPSGHCHGELILQHLVFFGASQHHGQSRWVCSNPQPDDIIHLQNTNMAVENAWNSRCFNICFNRVFAMELDLFAI